MWRVFVAVRSEYCIYMAKLKCICIPIYSYTSILIKCTSAACRSVNSGARNSRFILQNKTVWSPCCVSSVSRKSIRIIRENVLGEKCVLKRVCEIAKSGC